MNFNYIYNFSKSLFIKKRFYVRPSGGDYGLENGKSFENAWDGEANIEWNKLKNKTLIAYQFADDSITSQEPTTTIIYVNGGIGSMEIGATFMAS